MVTLQEDLPPAQTHDPYAHPTPTQRWGVFALGGATALLSLILIAAGMQASPATNAFMLFGIILSLFLIITWSGDHLKQSDMVWVGFGSALLTTLAFTLGAPLALAVGVFGLLLAALLASSSWREALYAACLLWTLHLPALLVIVFTLGTSDSLTAFVGLIGALVLRWGIVWWLHGRAPLETIGYTPPLLVGDVVLNLVAPVVAAAVGGNAWWAGALMFVPASYAYRDYARDDQADVDAPTPLPAYTASLERSADVEQQMLRAFDRETALNLALTRAREIAHAEAGAVFWLNSHLRRHEFATAQGLTDAQRAAWAAFSLPLEAATAPDTWQTVQTGTHNRAHFPELDGAAYTHTLETTLQVGSQLLGSLRLYLTQPTVLSATDESLLVRLARHTALLVDNIDYLNNMETYAFELAQLAHLSRISTSSLSLDAVLADMIRIMREMVVVKKVSLALMHTEHAVTPLLDLYGDAKSAGTLSLDSVPELAVMRQQQRPHSAQFKRGDAALSTGMNDLLDLHGNTLTVFPLISYRDLLGLILLGDAEFTGASDRKYQLLEMASNQIAAHVVNARLYQMTNQRLDQQLEQLNILATIVQQISSALDPDSIIATMLEMAVKSTSANVGTVALLQDGEEVWKIISYNDSGALGRSQRSRFGDDGIFGQVARTRETMVISDTRETALYFASSNPNLYLSAVGVPLISEGKVIGVLHMESLRPDFFTPEQVSFLTNLARHAVISIENAQLLEERQHQIMTLRSVQRLSMRLSHVTETAVVAYEVSQTALDMLNGRKAALFRVTNDFGANKLDTMVDIALDAPDTKSAQIFRTSTIAQRAAQTGEIQIVQEMRSLMGDNVSQLNALAVPIRRGERVREILCVSFDKPRSFSKRELDAILLLASQAAGHLENANLHEYIRANNDRMRAILNTTRDGVILLDKEGNLVETNPATRRLLGIDLDEHIGRNLVNVLLQFAEGETRENAGYNREEVTALARQLRLEPERITRRQFSRSTPKQTLYIEEIGSPVVDSDNVISGRLLVLRDVTEQKLLADYRDEITHMAVHDLRGPLASIISSLNFTLEEPGISDDQATLRKTLGLSLDSANNLMRLVEGMLDISRLEKQQMPLRPMPAGAGHLINDAVMALKSSIEQAGVVIKRDIPDDLPLLLVDHDIVRRVLINLIDNAVRFTPNGGDILIEVQPCPNELLFRIADSGPGIPPEERTRVFERFRQVKANIPVRGGRGNGLGLTFCKLAVEAHRGRIWVEETSPLRGACFALTLPIVVQAG
jgi:PAS domain S-box-containing protein